jgi:hypothetical protein
VSLLPLRSEGPALLGELSTSHHGPWQFFNSSPTYFASYVCTSSVLRSGGCLQLTFDGELNKKKADLRWDHAARSR